jgi:glycosyltransferase involved in cell wall biosynthesis
MMASTIGDGPRYLADFSLALINRTGAYYACRDIVDGLPEFFTRTRYWRWPQGREPGGLLRKLLGRAMLFELGHPRLWGLLPRLPGAGPTLFLDPLYVLRARLERSDIVLCHDVGPVTHAHLFDPSTVRLYGQAYEQIRAAGPGMVFVSEASKQAFTARFGESYRFLEVIPLYVRRASERGGVQQPRGVAGPFLLTAAAYEARKNHARMIAAFQRSGLRARGYSYVLCGPRGNIADSVERLAKSTPGVVSLGQVSDAELRWLYRNACGFVLPSLLEGFGLPPLEASRHGLLSLISADGAQPEAVGEGAVTVDPTSVEAIAAGMRQLIDMPSAERARRLALARAHADRLSRERFIARWNELLARSAP